MLVKALHAFVIQRTSRLAPMIAQTSVEALSLRRHGAAHAADGPAP